MGKNLAAIFHNRAKELGDWPALEYKVGKQPYQKMSWRDASTFIRELAQGLADLGLETGGRAAIFSNTSHLWVVADLATLSNCSVSVPIYPTCSTSDIEYILNNSESQIVFVQNERLLKKVLSIKDDVKKVKAFVVMSPDNLKALEEAKKDVPANFIKTVDEVREMGARSLVTQKEIAERRITAAKPDELATIIYTSGTTGTPKGVPLTHKIIISVLEDLDRNILPVSKHDIYLSYLPLSHVFERVCGEFYWVYNGGTCAFAEGIEHIGKNLAEVQPTMILTVPRVIDKIYAKVRSGIDGATGSKKQLIEWALNVGAEMVKTRAAGKAPGPALLAKHFLAEKLVFKKLREKIGPRLRLIVSGGAPATPETLMFFNAVGYSCLEGYGLTETAAPLCVNRLDRVKMGTVGPTLPSVKMKLSDENELMVSGPTVFKGYYRNDEATREAFDGRWFKTGDIVSVDSDGYIKITDRKKDIIVNSAGKNIAPQKVEAVIKTVPLVNQGVVFGDKRKALVALLTLDEAATMEFVKEQGWSYDTFEQAAQSKELNQFIKKELQERCGTLADYEQVKKFSILPQDLSVEAGELTATLKIKRNVVGKNYLDTIAALYDERPVVVSSAAGNNFAHSGR